MTDTTSPQPRRGWRLPALAAAAVLAVAIAAAVLGPRFVGGRDEPQPAQVAPQPAVPATTDTSPDPTPSSGGPRCMRELADAVAALPEPAEAGRYAFVHTRWWGENVASTGGASVRREETYESKLWRAADGSGRQDVISVPGEPSREPGSSTYTAGGLAGVLPEPITTSPDLLATQLQTHSPPLMGPQWVLRAVADVYQAHATPQPVRVALLRVLAAQTTGLECEGRRVDRSGRTGIALAVNSSSNGVRDRLIFDPATGRLSAAEQVFLRNPPALSGAVPRTYTYWLFRETSQVDQLPAAYLPA